MNNNWNKITYNGTRDESSKESAVLGTKSDPRQHKWNQDYSSCSRLILSQIQGLINRLNIIRLILTTGCHSQRTHEMHPHEVDVHSRSTCTSWNSYLRSSAMRWCHDLIIKQGFCQKSSHAFIPFYDLQPFYFTSRFRYFLRMKQQGVSHRFPSGLKWISLLLWCIGLTYASTYINKHM